MSVLIRVPKKLEIGMAVVVKLGKYQKLLPTEAADGIKLGKWLKGKLIDFGGGGQFGVNIKGHWIPIELDKGDLIIRSVALADNKPVRSQETMQLARNKRREKVAGNK